MKATGGGGLTRQGRKTRRRVVHSGRRVIAPHERNSVKHGELLKWNSSASSGSRRVEAVRRVQSDSQQRKGDVVHQFYEMTAAVRAGRPGLLSVVGPR